MILDNIMSHKKAELAAVRQQRPLRELESLVQHAPATRDFAAALINGSQSSIRIIAEVKKASPSQGVIRPVFDPVAIAREYEEAGAAAVSVLTEQRFFQGSLEYLASIKNSIALPVLRKDFIFDPYQLYEARAFGADAVLLIVAALHTELLRELIAVARSLSLAALVEVHTAAELAVAGDAGALIIGINNRDLHTFTTDITTTIDLCRLIPDQNIVVSESGITSRADIHRLMQAGVDAFLIGEVLMRAPSPGLKLRELLSS